MKRLLCFVTCFLILSSGGAEEVIHLWSGREQKLPGSGKWVLSAEHGRVLANGNDEIVLNLPALEPGATIDAVLTVAEKSQKVKIHSPKPLANITIFRVKNRKISEKLKVLGADFTTGKKSIEFRFLEKHDFPFNLQGQWDEISMHRAKISGTLSVLLDKRESVFDLNGNCSYALLRKQFRQQQIVTVLFPPDFDLERIENVLLLKQLLKENQK